MMRRGYPRARSRGAVARWRCARREKSFDADLPSLLSVVAQPFGQNEVVRLSPCLVEVENVHDEAGIVVEEAVSSALAADWPADYRANHDRRQYAAVAPAKITRQQGLAVPPAIGILLRATPRPKLAALRAW